jgi:hypothetical protein
MILENIKSIDSDAQRLFEQVFDSKIEDERSALSYAVISMLKAAIGPADGAQALDALTSDLEAQIRTKALIEAGSRAKVSKKVILDDLSLLALCMTCAVRQLESGSLAEALRLTVTAARVLGIAEADFRQLQIARQKTGRGGRKTQETNKLSTERAAERVLAAWRKMDPKPKSAARAAERLIANGIGVPYRKISDLISREMKSEKARLNLHPTEQADCCTE